jgi:hypothetical protein
VLAVSSSRSETTFSGGRLVPRSADGRILLVTMEELRAKEK